MKRCLWLILLCVLLAFIVGAVVLARHRAAFVIEEHVTVDRFPRLRPDYAETVIPPNIAPLNFLVEEPGTHYRVKIHSARGAEIIILSRSPKIIIPAGPWKQLLQANRGEDLLWDIYVRGRDDRWSRFDTITNTIAPENIDGYLVYRLIKSVYNFWREMGVYQRNLANYEESVVLHSESAGPGCVNCHAFWNNRTAKMVLAVRNEASGSSALLSQGDVVTNVGPGFGITSWHPSGQLVAGTIRLCGPRFSIVT